MKDALTKEMEDKILAWLKSDSENTTLLADEIAKLCIQKQIHLLEDLVNDDRGIGYIYLIYAKLRELKSQLKNERGSKERN